MEEKQFEAITTQEQLNAVVEPLLKAERDKFKDYADLQKKAGTVEKLQSQITDLTARITTLQNEALQRKIAHEEGLPYELAGRLTGKDEKEMRTDAQALAKYIVKKSAPPLHDPEPEQTQNSEKSALKEVLSKLRKD